MGGAARLGSAVSGFFRRDDGVQGLAAEPERQLRGHDLGLPGHAPRGGGGGPGMAAERGAAPAGPLPAGEPVNQPGDSVRSH